jgi:hypothetical protein
MIEKSESNTGKKVDEVGADSGYASYDNYEYLDKRKINGYVPDQYFHQYKSGDYQKEENRYHSTNFRCDKSTDRYICPDGHALVYWKTRKNKTKGRDWNHRVYIGKECKKCINRAFWATKPFYCEDWIKSFILFSLKIVLGQPENT